MEHPISLFEVWKLWTHYRVYLSYHDVLSQTDGKPLQLCPPHAHCSPTLIPFTHTSIFEILFQTVLSVIELLATAVTSVCIHCRAHTEENRFPTIKNFRCNAVSFFSTAVRLYR